MIFEEVELSSYFILYVFCSVAYKRFRCVTVYKMLQ